MELEKVIVENDSVENIRKLHQALKALPKKDKWICKTTAEEIPLIAKYSPQSKITEIIAKYDGTISIDTNKFDVTLVCFNPHLTAFKYKEKTYVFKIQKPKTL